MTVVPQYGTGNSRQGQWVEPGVSSGGNDRGGQEGGYRVPVGRAETGFGVVYVMPVGEGGTWREIARKIGTKVIVCRVDNMGILLEVVGVSRRFG